MNGFDLTRYIEQKGMAALVPLLESYADGGHFTLINKGPLVPMLQATIGDVLMNRNGGCYSLEAKIEECDLYDNFFLETWSNKKFEPRKLGWMLTLQADIFWYYFLESDELYSLSFRRLWEWAFLKPQAKVDEGRGRIYDFPERLQTKTRQPNETWGRCVPISVIAQEVGCVMYHPRKSLNAIVKRWVVGK